MTFLFKKRHNKANTSVIIKLEVSFNGVDNKYHHTYFIIKSFLFNLLLRVDSVRESAPPLFTHFPCPFNKQRRVSPWKETMFRLSAAVLAADRNGNDNDDKDDNDDTDVSNVSDNGNSGSDGTSQRM